MINKLSFLPSVAFAAGALVCAVHLPSGAQESASASDESAERWICRRAESSTQQNATMTAPTSIQLQCKSVRIVMRPGNGMKVIGSVHATSRLVAPSYSGALTPQQLNDAWTTFIRSQVFGEFDNRGGG